MSDYNPVKGPGVEVPKKHGGFYIEGSHTDAFSKLENCLFKKKKSKIGLDTFKFSGKDIKAHQKWERKYNVDILEWERFFIKYMQMVKVGSNVECGWKSIVTSSFTPCIDNANLIRAGWNEIFPTNKQFEFDDKSGLFIEKHPTIFHERADREARERLQDELGFEIITK